MLGVEVEVKRGWRGDRSLQFALIVPAVCVPFAALRAIVSLLWPFCSGYAGGYESDPGAKGLCLVEGLGHSYGEFAVVALVSFAALAILTMFARRRGVRTYRVSHQAAWVATVGTLSCVVFFWISTAAFALMVAD